jgi:ubiquinone/menaquinone biosynthesis C-methylase UbiE
MIEENREPAHGEHYIHNYDAAHAKQVVRRRSAETHAAFFLTYLRPGMSLLDCGCGPGTITIDLAGFVSPGEAVGIDIEMSQIELARSNAAGLSSSNISFEVGSVYSLPYSDGRFDAVFSHALLEHLSDPLTILEEMYRVLKTGGIVGVRSPDWAGALISPEDDILDYAIRIYCKYRQHNGGMPFIGRRLRGLLRTAGFIRTVGSASYETWGTPEAVEAIVSVLLEEFAGSALTKQAVEMGWADDSQMAEITPAVKRWGEHPDAFFAHPWCEAVGWKG